MSNGQKNAAFLAAIPAKTKDAILTNIANHYGISDVDAFAEITHDDAEILFDYVTGPERMAAYALWQRKGIAA